MSCFSSFGALYSSFNARINIYKKKWKKSFVIYPPGWDDYRLCYYFLTSFWCFSFGHPIFQIVLFLCMSSHSLGVISLHVLHIPAFIVYTAEWYTLEKCHILMLSVHSEFFNGFFFFQFTLLSPVLYEEIWECALSYPTPHNLKCCRRIRQKQKPNVMTAMV